MAGPGQSCPRIWARLFGRNPPTCFQNCQQGYSVITSHISGASCVCCPRRYFTVKKHTGGFFCMAPSNQDGRVKPDPDLPPVARSVSSAGAVDDPAWLARELVWHDRGTERLAGTRRVPGLSTADIRRLWSEENGGPMLDSLPVEPEQAVSLNALLPVSIDLGSFDYFLESCTVDCDRTVAEGGFRGNYPAPCGFLEKD